MAQNIITDEFLNDMAYWIAETIYEIKEGTRNEYISKNHNYLSER